jgi:hypothetical protein
MSLLGDCQTGYIRNPRTNRCIKINGATARSIGVNNNALQNQSPQYYYNQTTYPQQSSQYQSHQYIPRNIVPQQNPNKIDSLVCGSQKCKRCQSTRLLTASGHGRDQNNFDYCGESYTGYANNFLPGNKDEMSVVLCMNCGQEQLGDYPIAHDRIVKLMNGDFSQENQENEQQYEKMKQQWFGYTSVK